MAETVRFKILGVPAPQGGSRGVPTAQGVRLISTGGKGLASWRTAVSDEAIRAALALPAPLDGALRLDVLFRFPMPASRPKAIRLLGTVPKTTTPDTSKLVRAVEDAFTAAKLITDDARFACIHAEKVETTGWTGATVAISSYGRVRAELVTHFIDMRDELDALAHDDDVPGYRRNEARDLARVADGILHAEGSR